MSNPIICKTRCHVSIQAYLRVVADRVEEIHLAIKVGATIVSVYAASMTREKSGMGGVELEEYKFAVVTQREA